GLRGRTRFSSSWSLSSSLQSPLSVRGRARNFSTKGRHHLRKGVEAGTAEAHRALRGPAKALDPCLVIVLERLLQQYGEAIKRLGDPIPGLLEVRRIRGATGIGRPEAIVGVGPAKRLRVAKE